MTKEKCDFCGEIHPEINERMECIYRKIDDLMAENKKYREILYGIIVCAAEVILPKEET